EASAVRRRHAPCGAPARRACAVRPPGDGDQRGAGRGIDSDHRRRARRRERGAALFVESGLVVAAARAEELREMAQAPVLERTEVVEAEVLDRFAQQLLGFVVATLCAADDA